MNSQRVRSSARRPFRSLIRCFAVGWRSRPPGEIPNLCAMRRFVLLFLSATSWPPPQTCFVLFGSPARMPRRRYSGRAAEARAVFVVDCNRRRSCARSGSPCRRSRWPPDDDDEDPPKRPRSSSSETQIGTSRECFRFPARAAKVVEFGQLRFESDFWVPLLQCFGTKVQLLRGYMGVAL